MTTFLELRLVQTKLILLPSRLKEKNWLSAWKAWWRIIILSLEDTLPAAPRMPWLVPTLPLPMAFRVLARHRTHHHTKVFVQPTQLSIREETAILLRTLVVFCPLLTVSQDRKALSNQAEQVLGTLHFWISNIIEYNQHSQELAA